MRSQLEEEQLAELRTRARAAAEKEAQRASRRTATELQQTAAGALEELLNEGKDDLEPGVTVGPLAVREGHAENGYRPVSVTVAGVTFEANFRWGGSAERYFLAGQWKAVRRTFGIRREQRCLSIADLDGWL